MLLVVLLVSYVTYSRVFFPINAGLQGRHVLPIVALVPIWSGVVVAERLRGALFAVAVRVAAVLLPLVVLVGPLPQRQAVCGGAGRPVRAWFVTAAQWTPPLGLVPLAGARGRWLRPSRGRVGPCPGPGQGRLRDGPVRSPIPGR